MRIALEAKRQLGLPIDESDYADLQTKETKLREVTNMENYVKNAASSYGRDSGAMMDEMLKLNGCDSVAELQEKVANGEKIIEAVDTAWSKDIQKQHYAGYDAMIAARNAERDRVMNLNASLRGAELGTHGDTNALWAKQNIQGGGNIPYSAIGNITGVGIGAGSSYLYGLTNEIPDATLYFTHVSKEVRAYESMWGGNGNTTGLGTRHEWLKGGSKALSYVGTMVNVGFDYLDKEAGNMTDHRFWHNTSANIGLLGTSLAIPGAGWAVVAISAVNATPAGDIVYAHLNPVEYQYGSKSNATYLNTWHIKPNRSWYNSDAEYRNSVESYRQWNKDREMQKERERKLKYLYQLR